MAVYLPLKGPGASDPKAPAVSGWASPDYESLTAVGRFSYDPVKWVGLRCDDLVVIDCDSLDALKLWFKDHGDDKATHIVKTPRGFHCYYEWTESSPSGPHTAIFGPDSHIDVRAGRGAYVVCPPTPGYQALDDEHPTLYDPAWWTPAHRALNHAKGWDFIPEGQRNDTLMRIAGTMRAVGASKMRIGQFLNGLNKLVCDPPLPKDEVAQIAASVCRYSPDPIEIIVED